MLGRRLIIYFIISIFLIHTSFAATINLDTDFNGVGYLSQNGGAGGNGSDYIYSLKMDSLGRYVATGYSANAAGNYDLVVWRYNSDGTLDTSFNNVGYVTHHGAAGGNGNDAGFDLEIDSLGRYVISGFSFNSAGNGDLAIWRYNSNGILDTSFNNVGYVLHNNAAGGNGWDNGYSLKIDSLGKYVVAGYSTNASGKYDMTVWRYNSDGTLDTSFNNVGYVTHHGAAGGNGYDYGFGITVDTFGRYVITGNSTNLAGNTDMTIWRYTPDGTLDTSFNNVGYVSHNNAAGGNGYDTAYSVEVDSSGRYVVAGYSANAAGNNDVTVWRYNPNGTLDTSFSSDGIFTQDFSTNGNKNDAVYAYSGIYFEDNGAITITFYLKTTYTTADIALLRLNTDGTLDTTLNGTGYVYLPKSTGDDIPYAIASDGNGKYVLAGNTTNTNIDTGIWVILDFPHTITLDSVGDLYGVSNLTVAGNVSAPKSTTNIGNVYWSLDDEIAGTWTACTADDGTFDSLSEDFTCAVNGIPDGNGNVYIKSCDQYGSCTRRVSYANIGGTTIDTKKPNSKKIGLSKTSLKTIGKADLTADKNEFKLFFDVSDSTTSVDKIMVSQNKNFKNASWKDYDGNINLKFSNDGKKYIYFKFKDEAGNESDVYQQLIKVDTTAPAITVTQIGTFIPDFEKYKNFIYTEENPSITLTTEKDAMLILYVDGQEDQKISKLNESNATCTQKDGPDECTTTLQPTKLTWGKHEMTLITEDDAGHQIERKFNLNIDSKY
jgi:uncharacterized delta-60 repeat protein